MKKNNDNTVVDNFKSHTEGNWFVVERNREIFVECEGIDHGDAYQVEICKLYGNQQIDKSDAAYICEAVNNYQKLKEEVRKDLLTLYHSTEDKGVRFDIMRIVDKLNNTKNL